MKIAVAFDSHGVCLRAPVIAELLALGHEVLDVGTDSPLPGVDCSDKALELGAALQSGRVERGVFVCGSGVRATIAANKIPGLRACMCHDTLTARQGAEQDDMNVLCLGSEMVARELARQIVRAFATAEARDAQRLGQRSERRGARTATASDQGAGRSGAVALQVVPDA